MTFPNNISTIALSLIFGLVACQQDDQKTGDEGACVQIAQNIEAGDGCDESTATYQDDCEVRQRDAAEYGCKAEYAVMLACSATRYLNYECDEDGPIIQLESEDPCEAEFNAALRCVMDNMMD